MSCREDAAAVGVVIQWCDYGVVRFFRALSGVQSYLALRRVLQVAQKLSQIGHFHSSNMSTSGNDDKPSPASDAEIIVKEEGVDASFSLGLGKYTPVSCYLDELSPSVATTLLTSFYSNDFHSRFHEHVPYPIRAAVVDVAEHWNGYEASSACPVYNLVLMDGCNNLFLARLNSCLCVDMHESGSKILSGGVLVIRNCALIQKTMMCDDTKRAFLQVSEMEYEQPAKSRVSFVVESSAPHEAEAPGRSKTETPTTYLIREEDISTTGTGHLVRLSCLPHPNCWSLLCVPVNDEDYYRFKVRHFEKKESRWYCQWTDNSVSGKKHQLDSLFENEASSVLCGCQKLHEFSHCVAEVCPLTKLDENHVFSQASKQNEELAAFTFDLLPVHMKRWCFYWWYAVNLYGVHARESLPDCLVQHVHHFYPNMEGTPHAVVPKKDQAGKSDSDTAVPVRCRNSPA